MPTVLITGAGRGLGLELARQYIADGWNVMGTVRNPSATKTLEGMGARALLLDVTDFDAVKRFPEQLRGEPIDLLICNAGITGRRGMALGSFDYEDWDKVLRVNVLGAAATIDALVDNVAASQKKIIAVMSSRMGSISHTSGATIPYSSSKAALNLVAKAFAVQLSSRGIVVVALHPGWVKTDMGGSGAPLTPAESVQGLRRVLGALTSEHAGQFLAHDGSVISW